MRFFTSTLVLLFFYSSLTFSDQQQNAPLVINETSKIKENWLQEGVYKLIQPVPATAYWYVHTSVYTRHFSPKPEHNNRQKLIGIERNTDQSYLWGAAAFLNSFEQRSIYGYVGKRFDFAETPFYSKLTGGFIHGYRGEFRNKVPFNKLKFAPVILPSIGDKFKNIQTEAILLGANAIIVTVGVGI